MKEDLQTTVNRLHEDAMDLAEIAFFARRREENVNYYRYILKALNFEKAAARLLEGKYEIEPTRSVLYQSAAYLALNLDYFDEAEQLLKEAKKGNPPTEIRQELEDMLAGLSKKRNLRRNILQVAQG